MACDRGSYVLIDWWLATWTSAVGNEITVLGLTFPDQYDSQTPYLIVYSILCCSMLFFLVARSQWAVFGELIWFVWQFANLLLTLFHIRAHSHSSFNTYFVCRRNQSVWTCIQYDDTSCLARPNELFWYHTTWTNTEPVYIWCWTGGYHPITIYVYIYNRMFMVNCWADCNDCRCSLHGNYQWSGVDNVFSSAKALQMDCHWFGKA